MKKSIILMLVFMNILNFSGCPFNTYDSKEYDPRYSIQSQDRVYNEETLKEILECFDNKESDKLLNMFSEAVKSEYDLKSQIETAFEIYGGESVSYEGFWDSGYTSLDTKDGICIQKSVGASMKGIKTNNHENFVISFTKCILNDDHPNELGIKDIYLTDPEYGHLAKIGRVDNQDIRIIDEINRRRNTATSFLQE